MIVNPASGSFSEEGLRVSAGLLRRRFREVSILFTGRRGDAESMARDAVRGTPELILVVGGDGTFNEVVNGTAYSGVPVAFIPTGTTNVLARELGIPREMEQATLRALEGRTEYVNLGRIDGRYFALMAGIGFDGDAVKGVREGLKRVWGKGAYILSGLRAFLGYRPRRLGIAVDGSALEGFGLIVCNSGYYAGEYRVCPDASLRSPSFSIFIMHGGSRKALLRYVVGIIRGRHLALRDVTYLRGRRIEVTGEAEVQVDGDYLGTTPAVITLQEKALLLRVSSVSSAP